MLSPSTLLNTINSIWIFYFITNIKGLMLCRIILAVFCDNDGKHKHTLSSKCEVLFVKTSVRVLKHGNV
jgi:hypothetical protein